MLEAEIYKWLQDYNLKTPEYTSFGVDELPEIDFYPVALKLQSDKVIHKSDFNAVVLSIPNKEFLKDARDKIISNVKSKGITLDNSDKFIATAMIKGIELFVGVVDDDVFGKVILFGKGGIFLEMYKDVCYIDIYAKDEEIIRAIKLTKISKIFQNYRGQEININVAVSFIKFVQNFIKSNPEIKELDFNPVMLNEKGITIVDARVKRDSNIKEKPKLRIDRFNFFKNQRVAIIGASSDKTKVGYALAKNSLSSEIEVFFINTKGGEILGKSVNKSLSEIEGDIDTAVITIPAQFVVCTIMELIEKNIKNVIIISAGFKEVGQFDAERQIAELAKKHNFNVIGPNCLGYYSADYNLNLTFGTDKIIRGNLALLSQSGAVLSALMDKAYQANIGFSHIVSVGNMVDLSFAEMIRMLNNEKSCRYISVYAEGIQYGKEFLEAIRESKKPIYIFKTGKSEASKKAAFSHTGNLSGNYDMFKGLLNSVGSKIEDNIEALLFNPLNEVNNILIVTNAGGPASILTDYIIEKGKKLYELSPKDIKAFDEILPSNWPRANPVDIIGDALSDRFKNTLLLADKIEGIELIYVVITPQFMTDSLNIVKVINSEKWSKKIIPILLGGELLKDARNYCADEKLLFFKTLQSATSFL